MDSPIDNQKHLAREATFCGKIKTTMLYNIWWMVLHAQDRIISKEMDIDQ